MCCIANSAILRTLNITNLELVEYVQR